MTVFTREPGQKLDRPRARARGDPTPRVFLLLGVIMPKLPPGPECDGALRDPIGCYVLSVYHSYCKSGWLSCRHTCPEDFLQDVITALLGELKNVGLDYAAALERFPRPGLEQTEVMQMIQKSIQKDRSEGGGDAARKRESRFRERRGDKYRWPHEASFVVPLEEARGQLQHVIRRPASEVPHRAVELWDGVRQLPQHEQEMVALLYTGHTPKEAAARLKLKPWKVYAIIKEIRVHLTEFGYRGPD
jgi:hypothetical protein